MPESILTALILFVALYGLVVGIAAVRVLIGRENDSDVSSSAKSVSIVLPRHSEAITAARDACDAAAMDNVDVIARNGSGDQLLESALDDAEEDVVLFPGVGRAHGPEWIQAMSAHSTPTAPVVAGPTLIEHNDHFLPRLEALQQIGHTALFAGLNSAPPPRTGRCPNLAVRADALPDLERSNLNGLEELPLGGNGDATFLDNPDAAVICAPASSFDQYFERLVNTVRRAFRSTTTAGSVLGAGLWMAHALLLVCCVVAVALPAWRQPTLLALLGKMGADGLLLAPAARRYGERGLLRSFVPSELLLVIVVPFAGLFALPGLRRWAASDSLAP